MLNTPVITYSKLTLHWASTDLTAAMTLHPWWNNHCQEKVKQTKNNPPEKRAINKSSESHMKQRVTYLDCTDPA